VKYHIRTRSGQELTADGSHIVMLFRQKFLEPDDEIRKEGSEKWRKLRDIPEYASMMRSEAGDVARFKKIFFITALLACLAIVAAALFN
jgi:hypothetical protein